MNVNDERFLLTGPGDTILETIEMIGMSQVQLAERMGKTPSKINDLISGKESLTVNTAMQLETVLGIDTQFWMNRETAYREKLARIEQEEALEQCKEWLKIQPVKELREAGFIREDSKGIKLVEELLKFFGVVSPREWENLYVLAYAGAEFRKSSALRTSVGSVSAFLRIGELEMQSLNLPEYNKSMFSEALKEIRLLAKNHPEDYSEQLQKICLGAGVAVVYTISISGAPISGAVRWINGNPLVQLTGRFKTNDQFWFSFYHEAGHIILHGKKERFIEDFKGFENDPHKEAEADQFAGNWLLPDKFLNNLPAAISERDIRLIAIDAGIHPGIVTGRLQLLKIIPYTIGYKLKVKVLLKDFIKKKNKK